MFLLSMVEVTWCSQEGNKSLICIFQSSWRTLLVFHYMNDSIKCNDFYVHQRISRRCMFWYHLQDELSSLWNRWCKSNFLLELSQFHQGITFVSSSLLRMVSNVSCFPNPIQSMQDLQVSKRLPKCCLLRWHNQLLKADMLDHFHFQLWIPRQQANNHRIFKSFSFYQRKLLHLWLHSIFQHDYLLCFFLEHKLCILQELLFQELYKTLFYLHSMFYQCDWSNCKVK